MPLSPTEIGLRNVRVMNPHLHEPKDWKDGKEPKYEVQVVIRADDPQINQIVAIHDNLVQNDLGGVLPTGSHVLFKQDPNNPLLAGCWIISGKSKFQPDLMDAAQQPLMERISDGDLVNVALNFYGYTKPAPGVTSFVNKVMLIEKGTQKLGKSSGASTEELFGPAQARGVVSTPPGLGQAPPSNPF